MASVEVAVEGLLGHYRNGSMSPFLRDEDEHGQSLLPICLFGEGPAPVDFDFRTNEPTLLSVDWVGGLARAGGGPNLSTL